MNGIRLAFKRTVTTLEALDLMIRIQDRLDVPCYFVPDGRKGQCLETALIEGIDDEELVRRTIEEICEEAPSKEGNSGSNLGVCNLPSKESLKRVQYDIIPDRQMVPV